MTDQRPDTHHKALQINLHAARFGTFAEIGAGQEVARWFFHVGGASSTVAKTISAYDMAVSDAIYGPTERYVSRQRLLSMLLHEYDLLLDRLNAQRGAGSSFFVFADTVATRSHLNPQEGRGWLGIRFQSSPGSAPSQVIIHARMWDLHATRQQEALGILGVNLIYGAFNLDFRSELILTSLMDDLTRDRMEVDMIEFSGPAFAGVDNRLMSLRLVQERLTNAAVFTSTGAVIEPAELIYQKPVVVERGSFRPVTKVTFDMLQSAVAEMGREPPLRDQEPVVLMEMTLRNLASGGAAIDPVDFLARVDTLSVLGCTVMISNYSRFHNVVGYLRRYTKNKISMALGVPTLVQIFNESYYADLEGGLLEALGLLFKGAVTLDVYPWRNSQSGELVTADNFQVPPHLTDLYRHLRKNGLIRPIHALQPEDTNVLPRDVHAMIQAGNPAWETNVPPAVVDVIKVKRLFGYHPAAGG